MGQNVGRQDVLAKALSGERICRDNILADNTLIKDRELQSSYIFPTPNKVKGTINKEVIRKHPHQSYNRS